MKKPQAVNKHKAAPVQDDEDQEQEPLLDQQTAPSAASDKGTEEEDQTEQRKVAATQNRVLQKFLPAYLIAILADWLHGPYLYNVYEEKGYTHSQIGILFTVGFASSGFFGIIAGKLVDLTGRKRGCMVFCILYALNCVIIRSNSLLLLAFGRLISGIATSLLMSAFEAWIASHCEEQLLPSKHQGRIFALMGTLNSASAIFAGVIANYLVNIAGYQGPFDGAAIILVAGFIWISKFWEENRFTATQSSVYDITAICKKMYESIDTVRKDAKMVMLGLAQVAFETSMYIFVYVWVPSMEKCNGGLGLSNGYIFAILMMFMTIGSQLTTYHEAKSVETLSLRLIFIGSLGVLSFGLSIFLTNCSLILAMFCLFEFCCGIFFPTMGHLRSYIVPDNDKVTVINIFRTVLNLNVILFLLLGSRMELNVVFIACLLLQILVTYCGFKLKGASKNVDPGSETESSPFLEK